MQTSIAPRVSVVTPVYNAGELLLETAESMLSQTLSDWEWILVDDGSDVATIEIVQQLADQDDRIMAKFQENRGGSVARNVGWKIARGEYIKFLDADDLISPTLLEDQVRALEDEGNRICLSPHCILRQRKGKSRQSELKPSANTKYEEDVLRLHLDEGTGHPAALLYEKRLIDEIGGWDETLRADQDGDAIIRAALVDRKYSWVSTAYSTYRDHDRVLRVSYGFTYEKLSSRVKVLDRLVSELTRRSELGPYKEMLASRYDRFGRQASVNFRGISQHCFNRRNELFPGFVVRDPVSLKVLRMLLGVRIAEIVKRWYRGNQVGC